MGRRFLVTLGLICVVGIALTAGSLHAASAWSLHADPSHAEVEQTARVTLTGPDLARQPVLVVVEDGSPLRFAFTKVRPGRYQASARLLVTGTLTLQAMEGSRVLAVTNVTVTPRPGSSSLRVVAGLILLGFVFWFWYRSRQMSGSR
jgi:uncharacterized protein (DUF58 family)